MGAHLIERVRHAAGLSQAELASLGRTSRTTISAYEHHRKSPTLATTERIVTTAGFELTAEPTVTFTNITDGRGRPVFIADRLWRLPLHEAFATVTLPLGLNWSAPDSVFDLADRRQRARCYEIALREGSPADLLRYIDGALLVETRPDQPCGQPAGALRTPPRNTQADGPRELRQRDFYESPTNDDPLLTEPVRGSWSLWCRGGWALQPHGLVLLGEADRQISLNPKQVRQARSVVDEPFEALTHTLACHAELCTDGTPRQAGTMRGQRRA